MFGSVCPSVRLSVRPSVCPSKTSVCLSVIKERSRSKSCAQRSGAFNSFMQPLWAFLLLFMALLYCYIIQNHKLIGLDREKHEQSRLDK